MKLTQPLLHLTVCAALLAPSGFCADEAVALPGGIKAVWDFDKAFRESTPTRERVCINGLWRWQPAPPDMRKPAPGEKLEAAAPPTANWGYFKVPGSWPNAKGGGEETQRPYRHPNASANDAVCWYQREITIPASWKGRDVLLDINWLNSIANVYLDAKLIGNVAYPGGKLNISAGCKPGETHRLSICVAGIPLSDSVKVFMTGDLTATGQATVGRRGLCGDVYLESVPAKARIGYVKTEPSVRKWELGVKAELANLAADQEYKLKGELFDGAKKAHSFEGKAFKGSEATDGFYSFVTPWKPEKLWDTNATGNVYDLKLSLVDAKGVVLDTYLPTRVAFREFWMDGKDFRLNGSRIHMFAFPYNGALLSTYNASYEGAKEAFTRIKEMGFNLCFAHNYSANPGDTLSYEDTMRAADDVGMLFSFTMAITDPAHTDYYTRQVSPHPSVIFYAISHNNYGMADDYDPEILHTCPDYTADPKDRDKRIDGKGQEAKAREALITRWDSTRPIYHHGGNPSDLAAPNMYLNFAPIQEVSEWFTTWAAKNRKPLFPPEFGNAVDADFTIFRGFELGMDGVTIMPLQEPALGRKGSMRKFGAYFYGSSLRHEYHLPGWGAQFRGDIAYQLTDLETNNLRFEAGEWAKKGDKGWKFYSYPVNVNSPKFDAPNERDVQAMYVEENYPAFRTLGVSAINTWYYSELYQLKDNPTKGKPGVQLREGHVNSAREWAYPLPVDWETLQKPGYSPDWQNAPHKYQESDRGRPYSHMREDWLEVGRLTKAWLKVTRPAFAYIAGKPTHVLSEDRNFLPGETVEKTIIVFNETRAPLTADCAWTTTLPSAKGEKMKPVKVETGEQGRLPIKFAVPADAKAGEYIITLTTAFSTGETQEDTFAIQVLPKAVKPKLSSTVSIFDPAGKTKKALSEVGIAATDVKADAKPAKGILVIGKNALSIDGAAPDLAAVRDGLKVVVFEQNLDAMQYRLGFRTVEYGLRNLFPRFTSHQLLAGIDAKNWWNWRGKSGAELSDLTLLYYTPSWKYCHEMITDWAGITVNRACRGTTYGSVASIIPEKPHRGDFTPVLEGGFSLQYAPLMEYREGKGVVIFCQLDVSNRDESDPAGQAIMRNILEYADKWQPTAVERKARYAGDAAGKAHLEKTGIATTPYEGGALAKDEVLIIGPGVGQGLSTHAAAIGDFVKAGGNILVIGATQQEANSFLPFQVAMKETEHFATWFPIQDQKTLFAGINPAGLHSREPRKLQLLAADAAVEVLGNGILAKGKTANVVFCQMVPWTYDLKDMHTLKTCYNYSTELVNRILGNMGVRGTTTLLARFAKPGDKNQPPKELYVDTPVEGDDPYRTAHW